MLARSVAERAGGVEDLHCVDSRLRYSGPFRGRHRSLPARADFFISGDDRLRFQLKHPMTGTDLLCLILNGGRFLLVNLPEKKAYEGESAEALAAALPELDLRDGPPSPRELLFPLAQARSGEGVAMATRRGVHVLEFWRPGRVPTRRLEVDAWSHVPLKAEFFDAGGEISGVVRWTGFAWRPKERLVAPRGVEIVLPKAGVSLRLAFPSLGLNSGVSAKAFSLRAPPGVEVRQYRPQGGRTEDPAGQAAPEGPAAQDRPVPGT